MLSTNRKKFSMTAATINLPRILVRIPLDELVNATGRCRRTVRNWIDGRSTMSAPDLITVMAQFDEISNEVLRLAGKRTMTPEQVEKLQKALNDL